MTKIRVSKVIDKARKCLDEEEDVSPSFKAAFSDLFEVVSFLTNRLGLNSSNSSKPPSQDPNRPRRITKARGQKRKPGGQKGHKGSCLKQVDSPTESEDILIDRRTLPAGHYQHVGFESRQVFDIDVSVSVKEYRGEVVTNEKGEEFVASFPEGVTYIDKPPRQAGGLMGFFVVCRSIGLCAGQHIFDQVLEVLARVDPIEFTSLYDREQYCRC